MASSINWDTRLGWFKRGYRVKLQAEPEGVDSSGRLLFGESVVEKIREKSKAVPSPKEILETFPKYKVSVQETENSNIIVRDMRAKDEADLFNLLKRLLRQDDLTKLPLLEILRQNDDNTVSVIYGDTSKPWPKAAIERHSGVWTAKAGIAKVQEKTAAIIAAKSASKQLVLPADKTPEYDDDELGRPVKGHKREVA